MGKVNLTKEAHAALDKWRNRLDTGDLSQDLATYSQVVLYLDTRVERVSTQRHEALRG